MVSKQLPVRTMARRRQQRPSRKFHQPPSLWQRLAPVAWFNLTHDRTRLMVGLAGVAFAVLLNFMNLGVLGSLAATAKLTYTNLDAQVFLISPLSLNGTDTKPFPRERLYQAAGVNGVAKVIPFYMGYLPWQNPETFEDHVILAYGVNPADQPFMLDEIRDNSQMLAQRDTVLFDRFSRPEFGPQAVGTVTEAAGRKAVIGGQYQMGGGLAANGTLVMSDQNFIRYFATRNLERIDLGLLQLEPNQDLDEVIKQLRNGLPKDVSVYSQAEMIDRDRIYWLEATAMGFIFTLGVIVALIVGASIVYQILYTDIARNYSEYATLKAMGYRNRFLFQIILHQAMLLSVIGFIPGFIAAIGMNQLIAATTGGALPVYITGERVVKIFLLTFGMCTVSGLLSVRRVLKAKPADLF